jgi:SAM-dependent methyltransferase
MEWTPPAADIRLNLEMHDYTGPHDYFNKEYVDEWVSIANSRRPFRQRIFETFAAELRKLDHPRVLDIGSGPGFLAERVLMECDVESYHLFDFSPRMLELCKERLESFVDKTVYHEGSFLDDGWWKLLPVQFDAIVSLQAVHEVRDSERIPRLYAECRQLLRNGGLMLIADQINKGEKQEEHFWSSEEHRAALLGAGFDSVRMVCEVGDLAMFASSLWE